MESVNGKGYSHREKPRAPEDGPEKKLPVMKPLFSYDAEHEHGPEQCIKIVYVQPDHLLPWRYVLPQECFYPLIVILGGIYRVEDFFVPVHEDIVVHLRDKIDREICIVT